MFLSKFDKDEYRTRLVTTRNACPAIPASTSSRKSFTATRLSSLKYRRYRDTDLYSQDTRMYHYPYKRGRHLLTYAQTYTHAHIRGLSTRHTHTEYPASTGIDLAYPIDMSLSLPLFLAPVDTSSLTILSFTSYFETAISWSTMGVSLAFVCLFFSAPLRIWDHA